jgi:hydrogenase expression/formation protein HypC
MCLGIPGRITEISDEGLLRQGVVDFGGTTREICLAYVPEADAGDWVLVHVGFAISQLSEEEAARTIADLRELAEASQAAEDREEGP